MARVGAHDRRGTRAQDPRRGEEIVIEELGSTRGTSRHTSTVAAPTSAPTEFRLLYSLALEEGRVLTRDELLQQVWGRRASHRDRTVDVFVRKLREKVDTRASRHTFLQTRYGGVGYKLEARPVERYAHVIAVCVPQVLVDEGDRHAALADGRRNAFTEANRTSPREDAGHARLEQVRVAIELPQSRRLHVRAGEDEADEVERRSRARASRSRRRRR